MSQSVRKHRCKILSRRVWEEFSLIENRNKAQQGRTAVKMNQGQMLLFFTHFFRYLWSRCPSHFSSSWFGQRWHVAAWTEPIYGVGWVPGLLTLPTCCIHTLALEGVLSGSVFWCSMTFSNFRFLSAQHFEIRL